ncbi:MAG: BrnT family toxin [Aridibacter sp.]
MNEKRIAWDENKNKSNQKKHKISFEDASEVFFDTLALTVNDEAHSWYEHRFITIGKTKTQKLFVVFYAETEDEIRIISARKPTKTERLDYEEGD